MSIVEPSQPAVASYPAEGAKSEIAAARTLFDAELVSVEGWEDQGEREGVQLYRKADPLVRISLDRLPLPREFGTTSIRPGRAVGSAGLITGARRMRTPCRSSRESALSRESLPINFSPSFSSQVRLVSSA